MRLPIGHVEHVEISGARPSSDKGTPALQKRDASIAFGNKRLQTRIVSLAIDSRGLNR
jgi:hypothetical protein